MKRIEIEEVNNGYWVKVDEKEYVYSSIDIFRMLEMLGTYIFGKKVKVLEK